MVEAFDEDRERDGSVSSERIGQTTINLEKQFELSARAHKEWKLEGWYKLQDGKKTVGEVQILARWTPRQKTKDELREEDERTLFAAVMADDVTNIRLMLKRGVRLDARNGSGLTALELAMDRRKRKAASFLQKVMQTSQGNGGDADSNTREP